MHALAVREKSPTGVGSYKQQLRPCVFVGAHPVGDGLCCICRSPPRGRLVFGCSIWLFIRVSKMTHIFGHIKDYLDGPIIWCVPCSC
jgi:hypothetical protein